MNAIILTLTLYFVGTSQAYAYVDPGTASIALQVIIGGIAAASIFLRARIAAFFAMFRRTHSKDRPPETHLSGEDGEVGDGTQSGQSREK